MVDALIVYKTGYGATEDTAKIIANVLDQERISTKIVDSKKDKMQNINEFDLIIVGSRIKMGRWTKETEKFLRRFQNYIKYANGQKKLLN